MEKKDLITAESTKTDIRAVPDPEVPEKAVRRKFTAAYKLRIVKEAQTCTAPGQIGALLRREGIIHRTLQSGNARLKKVLSLKREDLKSQMQVYAVLQNWKKKMQSSYISSNRRSLLLKSKKKWPIS